MLLYSEYVIQEGISDVWKVVVNKAKQVLQVTPLVAIKNLLAKTRLGKFFVGKVDPSAVTTDTTKGEDNIKTNIDWLLSQTGAKDVKEALNGFFADGKSSSEITQIDGEDMAEVLSDLMDDISKESYNPKNEHHLDVPCFYGAIGIGKTSILKQVIHEWNAVNDRKRGLILIDGGQLSSDSFLLPALVDINKSKDAIAAVLNVDVDTKTKDQRLGPAPASFLPLYKPTGDPLEDEKLDAIANGRTGVSGISVDGGLIVVDEFFRADPSVFKNLMNIMQQRVAGGGEYVLGSKWAFVLLSNRPCDDNEVAEAYDRASGAFFGRITPYLYIPTPNDWYAWAEQDNHVNPIVISYVKQDETKFHKETGDTQFTLDPRNWEGVSKIINDAISRRYPETPEGKAALLEDLNKYTLLKAANDAVSTSGEKCPMIIKKIAAKVGVSETKEFCRYWIQVLDKEVNAKNNTDEDEMDGKRGTVGDDMSAILKEEVDDPRLIFKIKDSDQAENLGSAKFYHKLKFDPEDEAMSVIKPVTPELLEFKGLYVTLFGAYKGAPVDDSSFVTRRITTGKYQGDKVIAFAPLKGSEEDAFKADLEMLENLNMVKNSTISESYMKVMIANFVLLNSHFILNSIDKDRDEFFSKYTTAELFDSFDVEYVRALVNIILVLTGSNARAMRSDLDDDVFVGLKNLPSNINDMFDIEL